MINRIEQSDERLAKNLLAAYLSWHWGQTDLNHIRKKYCENEEYFYKFGEFWMGLSKQIIKTWQGTTLKIVHNRSNLAQD